MPRDGACPALAGDRSSALLVSGGISPTALAGLARCGKLAFRKAPIHQLVEECVQEFAALVLVIEIVGVLPEVAGEERRDGRIDDRRLRIVQVLQAHLAGAVGDQPQPPRCEMALALGLRFLAEGVVGLADTKAEDEPREEPPLRNL